MESNSPEETDNHKLIPPSGYPNEQLAVNEIVLSQKTAVDSGSRPQKSSTVLQAKDQNQSVEEEDVVPEENRGELLELVDQELADRDPVELPDYIFNPVLITRGVESNVFLLILSGKVEVVSGNEGFMIVQSAFDSMGAEAMVRDDYIPDFSAKVMERARILRIKRADYRMAISSLEQTKSGNE